MGDPVTDPVPRLLRRILLVVGRFGGNVVSRARSAGFVPSWEGAGTAGAEVVVAGAGR